MKTETSIPGKHGRTEDTLELAGAEDKCHHPLLGAACYPWHAISVPWMQQQHMLLAFIDAAQGKMVFSFRFCIYAVHLTQGRVFHLAL